jgi:hypothetical protein
MRWPAWWCSGCVAAGWIRTGCTVIRVNAAVTVTPPPHRGLVMHLATSTSARIIFLRPWLVCFTRTDRSTTMVRSMSVNAFVVEGWRSSVATRAENSSRPQHERL